jgi:hypothetical protein
MRFFYASAGLLNERGHHTTHCRLVVNELRARGVETIVLASARVTPALQAELGAIPFFKAFADWESDGDPVSGWLNMFDVAGRAVALDL